MTIGATFGQVMAAARAGGEWAWEAIYRDVAPSVIGYLRARGATSPEDVTGEVFLQLVRDVGSFEGDEGAFRAWVFTVARHRLVDSVRYEKRRPVEAASDETLAAVKGRIDPEEEALLSLEIERVRRILGRLSQDQQDVLMLRLFGQLKLEEVAQVIDKRVGAVKALQRRGLVALRRELAREGVSL